MKPNGNWPLMICRNLRKPSRVLSLVLLAGLLTGCSGISRVPQTVQISRCPDLPQVDQIKLLPHPPTVAVIDGQEWWMFDTQGYENMAVNHQEYLKVIRQLRAVNSTMRQCLGIRDISND